jgi:hypothetical protein
VGFKLTIPVFERAKTVSDFYVLKKIYPCKRPWRPIGL